MDTLAKGGVLGNSWMCKKIELVYGTGAHGFITHVKGPGDTRRRPPRRQ